MKKIASTPSLLALEDLEPSVLFSNMPKQKVSNVLHLSEQVGASLQILGSYTLNVLVYNARQHLQGLEDARIKELSAFNQGIMFESANLIIKSLHMLENVIFDPLQVCDFTKDKNAVDGILLKNRVELKEMYLSLVNSGKSEGLSKLIFLNEISNALRVDLICPIILYSETWYEGKSLALPMGRIPDLYGGHFPPQWGIVPWKNQAQSVEISKGFMATLCNAPHFKGMHYDLIESCDDLSEIAPSMNNNVQSIAVAKHKKMLYTQPQKN